MRAKQKKLLGILGALAVPIALVVGLYTDSGDLFKGYLTFEESPTADTLTQDTTARGYLASVINGQYDLDSDTVTDGFFKVYFTDGNDTLGNPFFTNERCSDVDPGAAFDPDNLGDQYLSLKALLQDRSNPDLINNFLDIKAFYRNSFDTNNKLIKESGLNLDVVDESPSFISYEDIQKAILVNYMAYKTANCTGGINKYHATNNEIIALNDLEDKLFKYDNTFQERQISATKLGSNSEKIIKTHLVASSESIFAADAADESKVISLLNIADTEKYNRILEAQEGTTDALSALEELDQDDFNDLENRNLYLNLLTTLTSLKTELDTNDISDEYVSGDKLAVLEPDFTLINSLSSNGDLAYDINAKATAYTEAVTAINAGQLNQVMLSILGFDMDGLTTELIEHYISKIERQTGDSAFGNLDAEGLLTAIEGITPDIDDKVGSLTAAITAYESNKDLATIQAIAVDQAGYLMHLQQSINESNAVAEPPKEANLDMLTHRQTLMLNLAKLAKLILEEAGTPVEEIEQGVSVGGETVTPAQAVVALDSFVAAKDFNTIDFRQSIDQAITETASHFGQDDSNFPDPDNTIIDILKDLFETVTQAQVAYTSSLNPGNLKNTVHAPFERIAEGLKDIINEISLKTNFDLHEEENNSYNIDMRAGSAAHGGFPSTLDIKTDLRDAQVDIALIQVQHENDRQIKIPVDQDIISSTINVASDLLPQDDVVTGGGFTKNFADKDYELSVMYSQDPVNIDSFSGQIDLSGLNSSTRNFRDLKEDADIEKRINPNNSQILLVEISSNGTQAHNFIDGSKADHLEKQYQLYIFNDKIAKTAALEPSTSAPNSVTVGEELNNVITSFDGSPTLPDSQASQSAFYALAAQADDCSDRTKLLHKDIPATIQNGNMQITPITLNEVEAGTYSICFAIYDDNYQSAESDINFVEPQAGDPGDEGAEEVSEDEITEMPNTPANATNVILKLKGNDLLTDEDKYVLVTDGSAGNAVKIKEAVEVTQDTVDNTAYLVAFGEIAPGTYQLQYDGTVQDGFVNVDEHKVLNPANNSTIGVSNPKISFECLNSYTYKAILTNSVDNSTQTFDNINCETNVGEFTVQQNLDKGARYDVKILAIDSEGFEFDNHFKSHKFTTSNNFLLTSDQVSVLDFTCGRQIEESKDANGIPIPGKRNVVIKGTTTNCAVLNPFPQAGISSGYMIKIGSSTPQTNAVGLQAIQGGFAATSIPVPASGNDYNIYVFVPGENEFVKTNSFVTPYDSNSSANPDRAEGDIDELVELSMPNTLEIGERVDLEIDIPENLDVHMMVVRYEGNEDDRDTRDFSGPVFIYCQEDITDHFEKSRDRRKIDRICEDFYEDDILEGPDTIEIEDFDTSRIGAEGDYDIIVDLFVDESTLPAELASESNSNTAYAQSVVIKQIRVRIEEAFEAEDRQLGGQSGFIDGRAMLASGVNFGYQPMHTAIPVQTQQCQTIFRDLNSSHQICKDIMYLYEQKLYTGVRMGNNVVSGVSQPAVRAHLFAFIDRVLKNYRRVPNYGVNYQVLSRFQDVRPYLNDPSQQWWLSPLSTLTTYGFVRGDGNYNVNPFGRVTQAQAAKLIGMATGLIPAQLQQKSPWYADIVAQYISYGMNLNPNAPATMGDLVVILSRSIQIMKNPNLFNNINQYAGYTSIGLY